MKSVKTDYSTWNFVVVGPFGWGRGESHQHAIANASFGMMSTHTLFVFKDDTWDIFGDGQLTYKKENLISKTHYNENDTRR